MKNIVAKTEATMMAVLSGIESGAADVVDDASTVAVGVLHSGA